MALVIRMKNVSRVLLFLGSVIVWFVLLTIVNDTMLGVKNDYFIIGGAATFALLQTLILAWVLGT